MGSICSHAAKQLLASVSSLESFFESLHNSIVIGLTSISVQRNSVQSTHGPCPSLIHNFVDTNHFHELAAVSYFV